MGPMLNRLDLYYGYCRLNNHPTNQPKGTYIYMYIVYQKDVIYTSAFSEVKKHRRKFEFYLRFILEKGVFVLLNKLI